MLLLANMHTMPETIERAMHIYRLRFRYLLLFLYCLLLAYGRTKIILYGNEHIKMKNTMQYALNQTHWRVLFILMVFFSLLSNSLYSPVACYYYVKFPVFMVLIKLFYKQLVWFALTHVVNGVQIVCVTNGLRIDWPKKYQPQWIACEKKIPPSLLYQYTYNFKRIWTGKNQTHTQNSEWWAHWKVK